MKQLTMTKVLTPLAALAFTFGAQAAIVPAETFDTYTAGTTVISNQTGWSFTYGNDGADDASAVTAYGESATPAYLPDGQSAGANYLKLSTEDGTLFRNLKTEGNELDLYDGLFVDTDVQFTVTDPSDSPTNTVDSADKLVIWLEATDSATNLCVLGHGFGSSTSDRADKVYTLIPAAGGTLSITPGDWYRLTVKAVSDFSLTGESVSYPAFQIYLNGNALKTSEYIATQEGFSPTIADITAFQPYIPARTATMTSLTKVGFSGEGALDSVVVTRDVPTCAGGVAVAITWDTTILDYVEVKTADGQKTFGETLTTSPVTIKVNPNAQFALVPTYKSGYTDSTHAISYAAGSGSAATVNATGVVTATGAGAIDITTTPRDTVKVSFDFTDLIETLGAAEASADFVSAEFKVNGTTIETLLPEDVGGLEGYTYPIEGLKLGTNVAITVTYAQNSGWTTEAEETSATSCLTRSSYTFTVTSLPEGRAATVAVDAFKPGATVDGEPARTFADALTAALTKGTATIALAANATVGDATIAANKNITIDLAGRTITGASEAAAVFSVAADGVLTITNSTGTGYVNAGSATKCIVNAGALNIQGGNFGGTIEGGATVTGGFFNQALANASCPTGQEIGALASGYEDSSYAYGLKYSTYSISYLNEDGTPFTDWATSYTAPATYTMTDAVTLPTSSDVDLSVVGVEFGGWTNETGTVTGWAAGQTGNVTVYAKLDPLAPSGEELAPGEQSTATFSTAEAATNALAGVTIAASSAVETALGDTSTYLTKFEKKVVESNGEYKIEIGLTAAATSDLTTDAGDQAATLAGQLSTVAATASATSVALTGAEPGFYYSVGYATTVGGEYTEGDRAMAASDGTVTLPIPAKSSGATAGFYKVFVNIADK